MMFNKILAAFDNTELGLHVFEKALLLAQTISAKLILLHVFNPLLDNELELTCFEDYGIYSPIELQPMNQSLWSWDEYEKEIIKFLQSFCDRATQAGVDTKFTQNIGEPGRVICDTARSWGVDLIVVGRRGRTGLDEFFFGSVSNYVLHHAPCSVLTIQAQSHAATSSQQAGETAFT